MQKPDFSHIKQSVSAFFDRVVFHLKKIPPYIKEKDFRIPKRFWKYAGLGVASLVLLIFLFIMMVRVGVWGKLPTTEALQELKQAQATLLYDSNEKLMGKYFVFDRMPIAYEELPQHLVEALIATEDARFYDHKGVDYRSLFRVLFKSILMQDESSGGGSTVSIQLAKNLFGRKDHGILSLPVSKVKEAITARRLERVYTKEDILTMYFNTVPFSDNTYGIESASRKFFNSTTKALTLSQSATLVGSLKASHSYNPRLFPEKSMKRRDVVLGQMLKYNYIIDSIAKVAKTDSLVLNYQRFDHDHGLAPYFREQVRLKATELLKDLQKPEGEPYDLYRDGLKIYSTLDATLQTYAESAMKQHMASLQNTYEKAYGKRAPWISDQALIEDKLKNLPLYEKLEASGLSEKQILDSLNKKSKRTFFTWEGLPAGQAGDTVVNASVVDSLKHYMKFLNTGFVAMQPQSGAVKAYVGGIDYQSFKYDHVLHSKRQVGSTFKPIVYTSALETGLLPCTYYSAESVSYPEYDDWKPENSAGQTLDSTLNYSMRYALSRSLNTIAVKVLLETGIDFTISKAQKMGITSDLPRVPSLALGTAEISLMELTATYASFVNERSPASPYFIERIEDKFGNVIWEHPKAKRKTPAFSETTRQMMVEMMKATVDHGTAQRLRSTYRLPNDMAGKTGTTQNNKDGWFMGVTPQLIMGAWTGNDDHRIGFSNTHIGQGANSALPMVGLFMQKMNSDATYNNISKAHFEKPWDMAEMYLDCDDTQPKSFFDRLFGPKKPFKIFRAKPKKKKKKKKGGIFSIFKKKNK